MIQYKIVAALLPAVVLIYCIYFRDKAKPEPVGQLLKGVGWGILAAILAVIVESLIPLDIKNCQTLIDSAYKAFCVAAIPEELIKAACLCLFLRTNKYYDEYLDGIVYAVCVGMGFAGLENIGYLIISNEHWVTVSVSRALTAVPAHFAFAVIMGYYYSLWRIKGDTAAIIKMLLYPIIAHGIYDTFALSLQLSNGVSVIALILMFVFLHKIRKHCSLLIKRHIANDAEQQQD